MTQDDFGEFSELWLVLQERYGKTLGAGSLALDFQALSELSIADVRRGLQAHVQHPTECRFFPMPGQIIGHVEALAAAADGRPGADEAWAIAIQGRKESETVVWTNEIALAFAIARPVLLDLGDEVGARKSFLDAYTREVRQARQRGTRAEWQLMLGHDPVRRTEAVKKAIGEGRIQIISGELLMHAAPDGPVALPATQAGDSDVAKAGKAALREARDRLAQRFLPPSKDATAKAHTTELRREALLQVETYEARQGLSQTDAAAAESATRK